MLSIGLAQAKANMFNNFKVDFKHFYRGVQDILGLGLGLSPMGLGPVIYSSGGGGITNKNQNLS